MLIVLGRVVFSLREWAAKGTKRTSTSTAGEEESPMTINSSGLKKIKKLPPI